MLSGSWQGNYGRDVERPRNNSDAIRFYYPYEDSNRFNASYERANVAGLDAIRLSGFFGTLAQRTDQDRIPTATRPRDIVRADITAKDFTVRATGETTAGAGRLKVGLDVNGRAALEAHDVLIAYDLAGDEVSSTDYLAIESAGRTDTALFVQGDTPLGRWFNLAGGLRGDYVRSVNQGGYFGDTTVSNGAVSGFGAVTAGPFDHLVVTAQVARGFRDPTLSDRFYRGPTGRGFVTGNPGLEPETSLQFDLGARYATGRLRLAGYYYHYRIANLVERYQTETDFFFFRNRGEARIQGFEAEAQADLGAGYAIEVATQRSRGIAPNNDNEASLDDISADMVAFVVRKAFGDRASAFARVAVFADDNRPGPSEVAAPGHTNLDVGATWLAHPRLHVRGAVRNLLDERYYASPDPRWVYAPGVNGFITLQVKF